MTKLFRFILMCAVCVASWIASAEDWPRWRGPRGDGISQETGLLEKWPRELTAVWSAKVGAGYAGPIAQDGKIYLFSHLNGSETLACYDALSGKQLWREGYKGGWSGGYAGTRASPNIDGDRIYTHGSAGDLVARNLSDGKLLWRTNVLQQVGAKPLSWAQASNPLIEGDLIYVQGGESGPVAIAVNQNTGKLAWRSRASGLSGYAHPIIADVQGTKQLIVFTGSGPIAMNPADGKTIWTFPWQTEYDVNAADPIYRDGMLFITSAYDRGAMMLKLSAKKPQKVWETKDVTCRFQPGILDGDCLFVNSEGTLKCVKWPTSEVLWDSKRQGSNLLGMGGTMLRVGDKMILLSQTGRLTLAKTTANGFEQISTVGDFVEGSEVWATPCLHNGRLYAKGTDELVCVDLRAK